MTRIAIPAAITVIVVAIFVGLAGFNRSRPVVAITLTERELSLPSSLGAPGDDPGVHLRMHADSRNEPLDARNWLTDDRLRALGFALHVPVSASEAADTYGRALPRLGWVVLEYAGDAWRENERRRALRAADPNRPLQRDTRLVVVDAGPELDPLIAKYPRGYLVLRATFGLRYLAPQNGGPMIYGQMIELHPPEVSVPRRLRDRLDGLAPTSGSVAEPRYEVDVALGRLGIPFITDIRRVGQVGR